MRTGPRPTTPLLRVEQDGEQRGGVRAGQRQRRAGFEDPQAVHGHPHQGGALGRRAGEGRAVPALPLREQRQGHLAQPVPGLDEQVVPEHQLEQTAMVVGELDVRAGCAREALARA
jgi:hypothetical protein